MRQSWILSVTLAVVIMVIGALIFSVPDPVSRGTSATSTPSDVAAFMPATTPTLEVQESDPTPPAATATSTPTETAATATATAQSAVPTAEPTATLEPTATQEPEPLAGEPFTESEVIIKLFSAGDLAGVAADHQLDAVPLGQFGTRPIFRMRILDGASPEDRSQAIQADPRVEYAEPNVNVRSPEWRSRFSWAKFDEQGNEILPWAPDVMRLPEAHAVSRGSGVVVAVLDTGIDTSHPVFADRLVPGYDFVDMDTDPTEVGTYSDETPAYGHGTHVAGLVLQAAPDARIMPLRVLDAQGNGNVWVLAEAIAYASDPDGNPSTPDGAQVINLSLGTQRRTNLLDDIVHEVSCFEVVWVDDDDDDDWDDDIDDDVDDDWDDDIDDDVDDDWDDDIDDDWDDDDDRDDDIDDDDWDDDDFDDDDNGRNGGPVVTRLSFQVNTTVSCNAVPGSGIVVVAAAGNSGTDVPEYPAAEDVPAVLSVGSTDRDDQVAESSSFGDWVDVAAPGVDVVSAMPANDFSAWSGTSMSAALVSGQAALIRSRFPEMTAEEVVARVRQTAVPIAGAVPSRIDAAAAVSNDP